MKIRKIIALSLTMASAQAMAFQAKDALGARVFRAAAKNGRERHSQ